MAGQHGTKVSTTYPEAESEGDLGGGPGLLQLVRPVDRHVRRCQQSLDGHHEAAQLLVLVAVNHLENTTHVSRDAFQHDNQHGALIKG